MNHLSYIDLSPMTDKIEDLQKALGVIENFCVSFGFKVNINKTEVCVFNTRGASTPDVQVYYCGQLIKVVKSIKSYQTCCFFLVARSGESTS